MNNNQVWQRVWKQAQCLACFVIATEFFVSPHASVMAQVVPDTTLGAEQSTIQTNVLINGNLSQLIAGGAVRNSNLFHSFQAFNIGADQRLYFANPAGVQTIFARVTGNVASNILGTLGVDGSANLFLLNPNGILFGRNAALDMRGSFVATTADDILFSNGDRFTTNPTDPLPNASLLQINPSALSFNRQQTQPITVQGTLSVPSGQSLLLVGGNVFLDSANLLVRGGQLEIAGLSTTGVIGLNPNPLKLREPDNLNRADVTITDSRLEVRSDGGGNATVYAQNLAIAESLILAGVRANSGTSGIPQAGDITIDATGTVTITQESNLFNGVSSTDPTTRQTVVGNSGQIIIRAKNFSLQSRAQLNASVFGQGNAGDIVLNIEETATFGEGSGLRSLIQNNAVGNGGTIRVEANILSLVDGAQIATSVLETGNGNGGNIRINVTDSITISGVDPELVGSNGNPFPSGILVNNESNQPGNAGDIFVSTKRLTVSDQAVIEAQTTIGDGGNITLNASDYLLLRRGGSISTSAGTVGAGGNGGNIRITTPFVIGVLTENSDISANAFTGQGGNIAITAQGIYGLEFQPRNTPFSDITASSQFGLSGSVTLNTPDIDPSKSLNPLSMALVEPTDQIAEGCGAGSSMTRRENRFVVTGPGGVPETPDQSFSGDRPLIDLTDRLRTAPATSSQQPMQTDQTSSAIVEAQGWIVEPDGTVVLVAQPQTAIAIPPRFTPATCKWL